MDGPLGELAIEESVFTMFAVTEIIAAPADWVQAAWHSAESVLVLPSSVFANKDVRNSSPSIKDPTLLKLSSKTKRNDWTLTKGWSLLSGCCMVTSEEQEKEGIVDVESVNTMIKVHEQEVADSHQPPEASSPSHHISAANFPYPWL